MHSYLKYSFLFLSLLVLACKKDAPSLEKEEEEKQEEVVPVQESRITPNDFLSDKKYSKLVVEILYVKGYQPSSTSVNNLKTFLEQRLTKPAGITIVQKELASTGKAVYSIDDLRSIEKSHRSQTSTNQTLTAYFFFADGDYAGNQGNSKVLGVAYGPSSMAIFEKTVKDYSGGLTQPPVSTLESTVIHHEFAHILGLVNNGTTMQVAHQDEPHGRHCTNKNCLMYYAAETTDIVGNLTGGNIPQLDARCIEDLRANGGR